MNRKGQGLFLQIGIAVLIWFAGVMALPLFEGIIDSARTGLQCASPTLISDGTKLMCLITDSGVILLIWTIISLVIGVIVGKAK